MSGHSKWSTIKRKKGALDAKRSKIFSRLSKEITVAIKQGSGNDPEYNPRLRLAIQNAKGANMPKDNIERAIKKGSQDGADFMEVNFEGYGPHGVAIFVECLTDNNQRTVAVVRSSFTKYGGSLGTKGSLSFVFEHKGIFEFKKTDEMDMDELELEIIDAGAEDIELEDDIITVICAKEDFGSISKKLDELGIDAISAGLQRIPNDLKHLDIQEAKSVLKLIEVLDDDDDIRNVYHNIEMTDELAEELGKE
jgi:YebC/PmpR family DNA-binding regulatory protein